MSPAIAAMPTLLGSYSLTEHAYERMTTRSISRTAIEAASAFGRCLEIRGALIFAIGRKEVVKSQHECAYLRDFVGTQVVVTADGAVMTVYRNSDFSGLRTRRRRSFRR